MTAPAVKVKARGPSHANSGYLFVLPFLLVFLAMLVLPLAYAAYLSLFREQLIGGTVFAGLENYTRALSDDRLIEGLVRVAKFFLLQVPIMLLLSLLSALAIDSGLLRFAKVFRLGIFVPYAVPAVVATLMWGYLYGREFGPFAQLVGQLGVPAPDFLSEDWMLGSMANIVTWEFVGYNMLIFYSALRVIPHSLYEAAEIDGAGQIRMITAIKLPAIRGALVIATIFSIIGSFQLFNEPNILRPLARNAITTDYTPNFYTYSLSFNGQQHNYSATVAIIMGLITMVIAYVVQLRGMRKGA
jgi:multiple sugar transport system permease protein